MEMAMTESRTEARTLDKADSVFRTLLEAAAEGIILVGEEGRIVMANRKALDLLGYESGELLGQAVEILVPERLREVHASHRKEYMASPHNRPMGVGLDLSARKKDGSEFPVEISLSHAGTGEGLTIMAFISDITKRRQLEEARTQLMEQRIAELETTLHTLDEIARPAVEVSARMMGAVPLRESTPTMFQDLLKDYARIMGEALERRTFKTEGNLSDAIDGLGSRLGFLKATPRDVIDLHSAALRDKSREASPARMRGYIEEGHFLLVELLGRLTTYYRNRACDIRETRVVQKRDAQ
jgi:PAS domain S-box-containing protein